MDYAALAKQYGGTTTSQPEVDYATLAKQYGGTTTVEQPSEIPSTRRSWSDVPAEALMNLPRSAAKFVGGMYEAVTSPVQTVKGILDIGAGALQNITPKAVRDFVNKFETNPEAAQRAVATANAVGGEYAKRYGSTEGLKEALATDPVAVISDFSTLLSGGAAATAKIAPSVSKGLTTAAAYTNPAAPIAKAAEYGLMGLSKGAGNAVDALRGQRAENRAGSIIRNALTDEGRTPQNILAAQQALRNAPAGSTVRQSLADVTAPQIQYLGEIMENRTPGVKMVRQEAERSGRIARMEAVTPDQAVAEATRTALSKPLYQQATQPTTVVSTAPLVQKIDDILVANPGNTKLVSSLNQVKEGLKASTTAEQVSSVLDNLKDLISSKDNKFIQKNLINVKKDVEAVLPGYQQAQQVFASASPPVNQAQVLGAMRGVLEQPLGVGERAGPFMTAMGRGEQALLKKATGTPRFTELSDVLTPQQMKVVGGVESELLRDAKVAAQTKAGAEAMKTILDSNLSKSRTFPQFLDAKITLTNELVKILKGKLNKDVMIQLEKGFQSGTDFTKLMQKIPASERIEVLRALGQAKGQLSPTKLNILAQTQNAMAPQFESENALAP
jgi:hypothetical protein